MLAACDGDLNRVIERFQGRSLFVKAYSYTTRPHERQACVLLCTLDTHTHICWFSHSIVVSAVSLEEVCKGCQMVQTSLLPSTSAQVRTGMTRPYARSHSGSVNMSLTCTGHSEHQSQELGQGRHNISR